MSNGQVERLLGELVRLTRVQVYPVAKQLLREEFFDGDEPRRERVRVYANLDGTSQREVAERAGVHQSSVSRWSNEWKRRGLVDEEGMAVFNVHDFFPELE